MDLKQQKTLALKLFDDVNNSLSLLDWQVPDIFMEEEGNLIQLSKYLQKMRERMNDGYIADVAESLLKQIEGLAIHFDRIVRKRFQDAQRNSIEIMMYLESEVNKLEKELKQLKINQEEFEKIKKKLEEIKFFYIKLARRIRNRVDELILDIEYEKKKLGKDFELEEEKIVEKEIKEEEIDLTKLKSPLEDEEKIE